MAKDATFSLGDKALINKIDSEKNSNRCMDTSAERRDHIYLAKIGIINATLPMGEVPFSGKSFFGTCNILHTFSGEVRLSPNFTSRL
jgi:hypothetical protein